MTRIDSRDRGGDSRAAKLRDAILAPLAEADPFGPDLSAAADGPFDVIAEARRGDDGLDQGVWVHDRKVSDWNAVIRLCQDALATRTKDLRLLAWLVEAQTHRDGFAALAPGLTLVEDFCRAFWPGLHPAVDEDGDLSARANAIALLNSRLPRLLRTLPLTSSGFSEPVRYCWGDYETARLYQSRGGGRDGLTTAAFQASAAATPVDRLERLRTDIVHALAALDSLDAFLDDACRRDAPSLTALKGLLEEMAAWLASTLPAPPPEPEPEFDDVPPEGEPEMSPAAPPAAPHREGGGSGPIASRDEAYRRLAEVADYLMRTEPHSPTPYVLRRLLAWGRMSLDEVLVEMASGRNDLTAILELIAIKE